MKRFRKLVVTATVLLSLVLTLSTAAPADAGKKDGTYTSSNCVDPGGSGACP